MQLDWRALAADAPACLLGESPFWHPDEAALYWCDIPGKAIHRWQPALTGPGGGDHQHWDFDTEPCSIAPMLGRRAGQRLGRLWVAFRDGLFTLDLSTGERELMCPPPYDPAKERFNDGKADAQGRFWVGTIFEPRSSTSAALYRWDGSTLSASPHAPDSLRRIAGDITVSNGLAFSADGRTVLWSDTFSHRIFALDLEPASGAVLRQRVWAEFAPKPPSGNLDTYRGRPDGAAMDVQGNCWVAMFEGQQLLCLSPSGAVLHDVPLPVRCATMPCFGGPDLRTLYVTTAREKRPAEELAAQPLAGQVLMARVPVPGLPVNFVR